MMTSQVLESAGFTRTQKSRYLENKTLLFLQIKKLLITHQALLYGKEQFCNAGNLQEMLVKKLFIINFRCRAYKYNKSQLTHNYFSRILPAFQEHLFQETTLLCLQGRTISITCVISSQNLFVPSLIKLLQFQREVYRKVVAQQLLTKPQRW